ncbi:MAG TPA: hypothetical protein EYH08_04760 [Pyrodictium sp.]|nr:hypothetical protein [Pyrodictium sp.]
MQRGWTLHKLFSRLVKLAKGYLQEQATEYIEAELRELENVFAVVVLGSLIGLPTPITPIAVKLAPYMLPELAAMTSIGSKLDDLLGEIAGLVEIT